jgi:hypothetical protein
VAFEEGGYHFERMVGINVGIHTGRVAGVVLFLLLPGACFFLFGFFLLMKQ